MSLRISAAPHVHNPVTTQRLMLYVIIALLPTAIVGVCAFGTPALWTLCIAMASAVAAEAAWQLIARKPVRVNDFSALVTGLILGLNLPSTAPWWMTMIGSAFAIIIVKQLFGGLGDNFLNPAIAARAVLLASWPAHMTRYVAPTFFSGVDAVGTATPLARPPYELAKLLSGETPFPCSDVTNWFLGNMPGTIGEVSKIAILAGFIFLVVAKAIHWQIPVTIVGTVALFSALFGSDPLTAILTGGVLFGAVFMATDYVTSPMTPWGQVIYGFGIGLIIAVVRQFSTTYPEGVTYAILLMNIATPLIDRFLPRKIYGYKKEAKKA